jgi:hypothetical protein
MVLEAQKLPEEARWLDIKIMGLDMDIISINILGSRRSSFFFLLALPRSSDTGCSSAFQGPSELTEVRSGPHCLSLHVACFLLVKA